jgi:phage gpG-like protein
MFGAAVTKIVNDVRKVREAADRAARRAFAKAAFRIGGVAIRSIKSSKLPSQPGDPPHTRKRKLPRAISYFADALGAVVGPIASRAGDAGAAHEFGGEFRGQTYPARPFMGPALESQLDSFAGEFAGSIGP